MRSSLANRAAAMEATTYPRPVSRGRAALPGVFGDLFAAREAERGALEKSLPGIKKCGERLAEAKGGIETATAECADLGATRGAADALLDLGRSEGGGAPVGAGPFQLNSGVPHVKSLLALCHHSVATVLADTHGGKAEAAAVRCVATLEIARDFVYGGTPLAMAGMTACVDAMVKPCTSALGAVPAEARGRLGADVAAVVASLPPFGDIAAAEHLRMELGTCAAFLDANERARLGPRARAVVEQADRERASLPVTEKPMHAQLCLESHELHALATKAYRTPKGSAERTQAMAEYDKALKTARIPPPSLDRYEEQYDAAKSSLAALSRL